LIQPLISFLDNQAKPPKHIIALETIPRQYSLMFTLLSQYVITLFDGYSVNYDLNKGKDLRITKLENDVRKLTFEVNYLKSTVNNLSKFTL